MECAENVVLLLLLQDPVGFGLLATVHVVGVEPRLENPEVVEDFWQN